MLEATQLTKKYNGVTALHALDLQIAPGEIFCLLGSNGAGTATTINLFLNFVRPDARAAKGNGLEVATHPLETKRCRLSHRAAARGAVASGKGPC